MSDFLGRGFAFPMGVNPSGGIATTGGGESIDGALRCVLSTAPGERVMRPDFGCAIWNHLFAPINEATLALMEQAVREAVQRWEPRAVLDTVEVEPNEDYNGRVDISIIYSTRTTNDRRNLVYPFYTIPQEQEE